MYPAIKSVHFTGICGTAMASGAVATTQDFPKGEVVKLGRANAALVCEMLERQLDGRSVHGFFQKKRPERTIGQPAQPFHD